MWLCFVNVCRTIGRAEKKRRARDSADTPFSAIWLVLFLKTIQRSVRLEAVQGLSVLPFFVTSFFDFWDKKDRGLCAQRAQVNGLIFGIRLLCPIC